MDRFSGVALSVGVFTLSASQFIASVCAFDHCGPGPVLGPGDGVLNKTDKRFLSRGGMTQIEASYTRGIREGGPMPGTHDLTGS